MSAMKFREPNQVKWVGVRPAHKGTQILKQGRATTDDVTLYTTPTGKTFYLVHYNITIQITASSLISAVAIRDSSGVAQYYIAYLNDAPNGVYIYEGNFDPPLEIPAGWYVHLDRNSSYGPIMCSIFGWEE